MEANLLHDLTVRVVARDPLCSMKDQLRKTCPMKDQLVTVLVED